MRRWKNLTRYSALIFVLVSLAGWGTWQMIRDPGPFGDLSRGSYSDHFSHMNTARLFTHAGINIWRKPLQDSARPLSSQQKAQLPGDIRSAIPLLDHNAVLDSGDQNTPGSVFAVPGWPKDKPFISSWAFRPRLHPIGDMIITAPVALLYSYTSLSFTGANRLLILLFLIFVHLSLYVLLKSGPSIKDLKPIGFLAFFVVYFEAIHWALEGFYEGIVIAPIVLCGRYLHQRKALPAIFTFTVAANLHFRSYFFAPLLIYAFVILIEDRQWRQWKLTHYLVVAASAVLAFTSLGVFALIWSQLKQSAIRSNVAIAAGQVNVPAIVTLIVVMTMLIVLFCYARAWLEAVLCAWVCATVLLMREALPWDIVSLLGWLGLPVFSSLQKRATLVRDLRLVAIAFMAVFVFSNYTVLAPTWLQKVFT